MNCQVCGNDSGKYPICRVCNAKKEQGLVIKCAQCGKWHYANYNCIANTESTQNILNELPPFEDPLPPSSPPTKPTVTPKSIPMTQPKKSPNTQKETIPVSDGKPYLYCLKSTIISKSEQSFYTVIKEAMPQGYQALPQIALRSFIDTNDSSSYHNELFRIVDFLVIDEAYHPKFVIEINDPSHHLSDRKERDEKVKNICEEAGIPIIRLWTEDGINSSYIKSKIERTLESLPVTRIHHFDPYASATKQTQPTQTPVQSAHYTSSYRPRRHRRYRCRRGCYVATCVYGSYDCPEVWMLRRFRDNTLASTWYGNTFIDFYYAISPTLVKWFGKSALFRSICKAPLDKIVSALKKEGVDDTPYTDQ